MGNRVREQAEAPLQRVFLLVTPPARALGLPGTTLAFAILSSVAGCSWLNGESCSGGCVDADGVCRQLSNTTCGLGGAECVDCELEGKACTGNGKCVAATIEEEEEEVSGRCCLLPDDDCVPLGEMCSYDEVCQMVRGGPGCKPVSGGGFTSPPAQCVNTCEGCCTRDGKCLDAPELKNCPPEWCDEDNAYNGRCESPVDRCKRECEDGCCTRDGKCERGTDNEQCGIKGESCDNCAYRNLECDREEQKCMPGAGGGGNLRVCLRSLRLKGPKTAVESCDRDRERSLLDFEAELFVTDGQATGVEEVVSGRGSTEEVETSQGALIGFSDGCITVDEEEAAELLVIELKELDQIASGFCDSYPDHPNCIGNSRSTSYKNCVESEPLVSCSFDLSSMVGAESGSFQQKINLTASNCQPAKSSEIKVLGGELEVRTLRSRYY